MGARVTSETRDRKIFRFTVLCLSSQIPYKEKKNGKKKNPRFVFNGLFFNPKLISSVFFVTLT